MKTASNMKSVPVEILTMRHDDSDDEKYCAPKCMFNDGNGSCNLSLHFERTCKNLLRDEKTGLLLRTESCRKFFDIDEDRK